ncbi:MAG: hypothetical protein ACRDZW_02760, partial [Acidimicrobiales bacterium]
MVPEHLDGRVRIGTIVRIPLQGRRVRGWVVAEAEEPPPAGVRLRAITAVSGWGPPPDLVELATWAAWRWAGRPSAFLRVASPPGVVVDL